MSLFRKGIIGELIVQRIMLERGFNVYNNICDDGGVDLIIEKNNIYNKIQVKRATKTDAKHNRLAFRLGDTEMNADFYICIYKDDFWIIPKKMIKSNAFNIYPYGKCQFLFFKNKWDILSID